MFTKCGTSNAIVDHLFGDSGTSRPRRSPLDVPPLWLVLRYQPILHNALRSALRQVNQSSALLTIAFEGASVPMAQLSYKKHDTPLVQFLNELTRWSNVGRGWWETLLLFYLQFLRGCCGRHFSSTWRNHCTSICWCICDPPAWFKADGWSIKLQP